MALEKYLFKASDFNDERDYQDLQTLTDKEIDQIFELINQGKILSVIRDRFPQIKQGKFDKYLPLVLSEEVCEHCGEAVYNRYGRDVNRKALYLIGRECVECGHNYEPSCRCEKCQANAELFWDDYLKKQFLKPIELDTLNVKSKVELSVLAAKYKDSTTPYLKFTGVKRDLYGRRDYFNYEVLPDGLEVVFYNLKREGILIPAPEYNSHLVKLLGDGKFEMAPFDMLEALWDINLINKGEKLSVSEYLNMDKSQGFSTKEKSFLWRSVYLDEISQYLNHQSAEIFHFTFNSIISDFITDLFIEEYSLSQAFSQIYYAMSLTLRYIAKYNPSRQKIASNFRNNIVRNRERFDRKKATRFNRPSYVEGSILNDFILYDVLKIKGDYFSAHTENLIPEFVPLLEEAKDNQ